MWMPSGLLQSVAFFLKSPVKMLVVHESDGCRSDSGLMLYMRFPLHVQYVFGLANKAPPPPLLQHMHESCSALIDVHALASIHSCMLTGGATCQT